MTMTSKETMIGRPADNYDVAAWEAFYAANPGMMRSIGAEGDDNEDAAEAKAKAEAEAKEKAEAEAKEKAETEAKEKAEVEAKEKAEAEVNKKADDDNDTSDREATLLKESMARKKKIKEQNAEIADLKAKNAKFDGLDLDAMRKMTDDAAAKEEELLASKGEFDTLKKRMAERHEEEIKAKDEEVEALKAVVAKSGSTVDDLTIGQAFNSDPFVKDKLVLTAAKARVIYGAHFKIDDEGQMVGYSKPAGSAGAEPFVDAAGDPLPFGAVIKKLVEADPDHDRLVRSTTRKGSGSTSVASDAEPTQDKPKLKGADKIAAGLAEKNKAA